MVAKEGKVRIKINKLLEDSGWRFFDDVTGFDIGTLADHGNFPAVEALFDAFVQAYQAEVA